MAGVPPFPCRPTTPLTEALRASPARRDPAASGGQFSHSVSSFPSGKARAQGHVSFTHGSERRSPERGRRERWPVRLCPEVAEGIAVVVDTAIAIESSPSLDSDGGGGCGHPTATMKTRLALFPLTARVLAPDPSMVRFVVMSIVLVGTMGEPGGQDTEKVTVSPEAAFATS